MEVSQNKFRKGLLFGVLVGVAWGLDGVLMGRVGAAQIFTDLEYALSKGVSELSFSFSPLVTAFFTKASVFYGSHWCSPSVSSLSMFFTCCSGPSGEKQLPWQHWWDPRSA